VAVCKSKQYNVPNEITNSSFGPRGIDGALQAVGNQSVFLEQLIVADAYRLMYWDIPSGPELVTMVRPPMILQAMMDGKSDHASISILEQCEHSGFFWTDKIRIKMVPTSRLWGHSKWEIGLVY